MTGIASVLVTGGAGFIGSHLCEALLQQGRRVVLLDNFNDFYSPTVKQANLAAIQRTAANTSGSLVIHKGDIRCADDVGRALRSLGESEQAAVVHLAAMAGVRPSIANPLLYHDVNVAGTLQLLQGCRACGVTRVAFASSSSVYGNNQKVPFAESDPVDQPISPYAASKRAGELICYNEHHLYGLSVACLRFFTVYGPRQRPDLAIHKFSALLAAGKSLPFFGDGSTRRDYTYVSDTLQGVLGALVWLESAAAPRFDIFNLGESRTVALTQLVELLAGELGITPQLQRLPVQPGDVECTFADISKARAALGYNPQVAIEEGLYRFVQWFRQQPSGQEKIS
ncbi:MAG: GDP-mannose 4,6-dehydratase [Trichloromonadaceae bacterium]